MKDIQGVYKNQLKTNTDRQKKCRAVIKRITWDLREELKALKTEETNLKTHLKTNLEAKRINDEKN